MLFEGLLRSRDLNSSDISAVSMCSVVPPLTDTVRRALERLSGAKPIVVGSGTKTGIKIMYDRPQDVGADRIVDAVAAFHVYGAPAVVVDLGTATVFDAISADGEYLGGALSPGISLAADALYNATSMLRRVELEPPGAAIGKNTVAALQSGLLYGYVGLVEGMVKRFIDELTTPGDPAPSVIATGGLAPVIASETNVFTAVDEDLTLTGLRLVHELNS